MSKTRKPLNNENGFASIVIALVLIIVLALLTVGFAQISRREQQTALNNQLASQAFYAAESGVNDAESDILTGKLKTLNKNTCNTTPIQDPGGFLVQNQNVNGQGVVNTQTNVTYTCVLVSQQTPNLFWNNVAPGDSKSITVTVPGTAGSPAGSPLSSLTIRWMSGKSNNTAFPTNAWSTLFPQFTAWNTQQWPSVLRFSITPLGDGTGLGTALLINNTDTFYAYPSTTYDCPIVNANPICSYQNGITNPTTQGQILGGGCVAPPRNAPPGNVFPCDVTINNLPTAGPPLSQYVYLIHFLNFYDTSNVSIDGVTATTGAALFQGQSIIDSTGKAQNVLKRIQVRISNSTVLPAEALQAKSICKRLQTQPGVTDYFNPSGTQIPSYVPTNPCSLGQ